VGKCLWDLGKEVEISSGEGGGCIDDGPDALAVGSAKDGSKLDDNVGEVRVDLMGRVRREGALVVARTVP
jgi:hypothetical protein